jgi:hypothetical protein
MAFVLTKKRIVNDWPIAIVSATRGGDTQTNVATADFEIIPQDEYNALMNDDLAFLSRVVVGFGPDLQFEDGTQIPCTTEGKKLLFSSGGDVRLGFINAYHEASAGIASKNSKGPRVTGQPVPKSRKRR